MNCPSSAASQRPASCAAAVQMYTRWRSRAKVWVSVREKEKIAGACGRGRERTSSDQSFSVAWPSGFTPRYFESFHSKMTSASCPLDAGEKMTGVRDIERGQRSDERLRGRRPLTFYERRLCAFTPHPTADLSNLCGARTRQFSRVRPSGGANELRTSSWSETST